MHQQLPELGVVIYTHDRVDDARINMEIIRKLWTDAKLFGDIRIVHAFNGKKSWWSARYLEDDLVRRTNPGHFQGASELIESGLQRMHKRFPKIQYVVVLAADTWLIKPKILQNILSSMKKNHKVLATCAWGVPGKNDMREVGMAMDFFVLDLPWARKFEMLPLDYAGFWKRHSEAILYAGANSVMLEKLAFARFKQALWRDQSSKALMLDKIRAALHVIREREPVHSGIERNGGWRRTHYWPRLGLLTHHDLEPKKRILQKLRDSAG